MAVVSEAVGRPGTVVAIYVYPQAGGPAVEVKEAQAVAGVGLKGDRHRNPNRAVTLLSQEAWQRTLDELGDDLPPCSRRANVVISGFELGQTIGRRLRLGEAEIAVQAETKPCDNMDRQRTGLREALVPDMRGGVNGPIEVGGRIRIGDEVSLVG